MASQRRRWPRIPISAKTVLATATLIVVFVLSLLSYMAPPLLDTHPLHVRHRRRIPFTPRMRNIGVAKRNAAGGGVFHVPDVLMEEDIWSSEMAKYYYGCSGASNKFADAKSNTYPNRYLMIATSGGLNQQRTGIVDAVVAARILNATLIVPKLDQKSFWKDASNFSEIFDVTWFISFLSKDVKILKQLPEKGGKVIGTYYNMRVPRKCTPSCYQKRVLPVLLKKKIVQLSKFDYRLSNRLDTDLQKLRCRVNYHALKFVDPIARMGLKLVQMMKSRSKHFIALHLRFEPDMLAFSGCYYGGGDKERRELGAIRKRWKTLHISNPEKERRHGKCPLTPAEVGLLLRALGFGKEVHIYVASGEVYGGENSLAPLKALFPNFHSKETLAGKELEPFSAFSSRMAALDFIVCDESDVFVTNNNGNMARILAGRRRYLGHKKTIRPNAKKLYSLFLNHSNLAWEEFASKVRTYQRGFMGEPKEIRPGRGEFHENPSACICESPDARKTIDSASQSGKKDKNHNKDSLSVNMVEPPDDLDSEEQDWPDWDYGDDVPNGSDSSNLTDSDYNMFTQAEDAVAEILSD